ncbi:MAG: hypothetical protein H6Q28_837 [Bacteroidetes bacterium]|nr:hypothetical protein [Bacteroidota bacterium]
MTAARAATAAVSARSRRSPRRTGKNPAPEASAISPSVNPPSGPVQTTTSSPPCPFIASSRGRAARSWGISLSPAGAPRPINEPKSTGRSTTGSRHRPHCFMAASATADQRSTLADVAITLSVRNGTILATPSSVAFSMTISKRPGFLRRAAAIVTDTGSSCLRGWRPSILHRTSCREIAVMTASYAQPAPSTATMRSPGAARKTRTRCRCSSPTSVSSAPLTRTGST